jgi:hypothetical protein
MWEHDRNATGKRQLTPVGVTAQRQIEVFYTKVQ